MMDIFTITEEEIVEIESTIKEMQKHVLAASAAHLRLTDHIQKHGADETLTGDLIAERSSIRSERLLAGAVSRGAKSRYERATFRAREIDECSLTIRRLCKEHEGIVIVERPKDGGNDVLWRDFGASEQDPEPFVIVLGYDMDTNLHRIGRIVSLDGDCEFLVAEVDHLQGISGIYAKPLALRIADEIYAHIDAIRQRIGSFL